MLSTPELTDRPSQFMQDPPASAFLFPVIPAAAAVPGCHQGCLEVRLLAVAMLPVFQCSGPTQQ